MASSEILSNGMSLAIQEEEIKRLSPSGLLYPWCPCHGAVGKAEVRGLCIKITVYMLVVYNEGQLDAVPYISSKSNVYLTADQ
jgi:hypothetical protein